MAVVVEDLQMVSVRQESLSPTQQRVLSSQRLRSCRRRSLVLPTSPTSLLSEALSELTSGEVVSAQAEPRNSDLGDSGLAKREGPAKPHRSSPSGGYLGHFGSLSRIQRMPRLGNLLFVVQLCPWNSSIRRAALNLFR